MESLARWTYHSLHDLEQEVQSLGLTLDATSDLSPLAQPVTVGGRTLANRMAVQPMEGNDAEADGSPGELCFRRYRRYAQGGASLIWFEAIACLEEGRSHPTQLWLTRDNLHHFKRLVDETVAAHKDKYGDEPLLVAQLTHSGRFSKPHGPNAPVYAWHDPHTDKKHPYAKDFAPVTDEHLEEIEHAMIDCAGLMREAGFHAIDVKACHKYLASELLGAHLRPGRYGGSFENRTRFIRNVARGIKQKLGDDIILATRLNLYDRVPYPYGFGVSEGNVEVPDLREPIELLRLLMDDGLQLADFSMGDPHCEPHTSRPYSMGGYVPNEHPLVGVSRLIEGIAAVSRALPELCTVGVGYGYLRQFAPQVAAAAVRDGKASIAGFGRASFAYPDMPDDILRNRPVESKSVCVACSKCGELLRGGYAAGCVVRDPLYTKVYQQMKAGGGAHA